MTHTGSVIAPPSYNSFVRPKHEQPAAGMQVFADLGLREAALIKLLQ
jgi:hypothetical protein